MSQKVSLPAARVLIVDDDIAVAGVHQGFVLAHGALEVAGLAHTGQDALQAIERLSPDLVLLDIYLPDMSGLEVLRTLRSRGSPVDVLAITAAREVETVREAVASGVWNYLVKPFTVAALHERLDNYLARRTRASALMRSGALEQSEIDKILGSRATRELLPAALPKGLALATLDSVRAALSPGRDASASEVAQIVGIARVSARRYLEHLVSIGEAQVRPRYGGSGRPENRYLRIGFGTSSSK